ncbi:ketosteroid isomerase-like protein [Thermocatellispora tengchongensis]|uniref:Ketosteroid isomerase-like protein n=1 Tax=Thermocatellispora tengchongensis TaxID=1073253 RepID=A0A840PIL7_9ACTN|nr:hypothetical protein [Thermocatellispora tengchongensis]MBB5137651.1 ketosteroid isomerase-like protein [Thermocatellispora tengchongensis]
MRIDEFFATYAAALVAGDLDGIAAAYAYPCLILADDFSLAVQEAAEVKRAFDGAAERHRAQGLVGARPLVGAVDKVTERLVDVDVRWEYLDDGGVVRERDHYRYTLHLGEGGEAAIRVVVAIPG